MSACPAFFYCTNNYQTISFVSFVQKTNCVDERQVTSLTRFACSLNLYLVEVDNIILNLM